MIKQEKVYPPLLNLIARCAMDKEKVIHEIKRDLRSPMVFRGLLIIGMFFLMIIYQVFCWFTYCWWIEHKDIRIWFSKSNISYSLGCSHLAANGLILGIQVIFYGAVREITKSLLASNLMLFPMVRPSLGRRFFIGICRYRVGRKVGYRSIWVSRKLYRFLLII